jgi:hypothetical protein
MTVIALQEVNNELYIRKIKSKLESRNSVYSTSYLVFKECILLCVSSIFEFRFSCQTQQYTNQLAHIMFDRKTKLKYLISYWKMLQRVLMVVYTKTHTVP